MPRRPAPEQVICQPPWEQVDFSELHAEIAKRGREISRLFKVLLFSAGVNVYILIQYIAPHLFGVHK